MGKKIDRTGEFRKMKNGMVAEIIDYRNSKDIDVKFEDGYISYNKAYSSFISGEIKNLNINNINLRDRTGEIRFMSCGMEATIIRYKNKNDIDVKFSDGYVSYNRRYTEFKEGSIKNPYVTKTFGVGICDTKTNKKIYYKWSSMLKRCYDEKNRYKHPTYKGVTVCDEWLLYSNFEEWYKENYYKVGNERMDLDKDILVKGNKTYSPETCIFVPQNINTLFVKCDKVRGDLPIGVNFKDNKYQARLSTAKGRIFLGYYSNPEEAFYAYKQAKEQYIKQIADEYNDKIPKKLYEAMYKWEVEIDD